MIQDDEINYDDYDIGNIDLEFLDEIGSEEG